MTRAASGIYPGTVVHKRLSPRPHAFRYSVCALLLDVDEIDRLATDLKLFSRNRFNLVSFHDRDHGRGDGTPVDVHARGLLAAGGLDACGHSVRLLCYPRLIGYVFNPLSVYFCSRRDGTLGAVIYEVTNTFRERTSYIIPAMPAVNGTVSQACAKAMYVSPFASRAGCYSFRIRAPAADVMVAVNFRDQTGCPVLKTRFSGARQPLDDTALARLMARHPMMTLKVIGAIHFEAARLWAKRIPLVRHDAAPRYSWQLVSPVSQGPAHA